MRQTKRPWLRTGALALTAALLLSGGAGAAEAAWTAEQRQEDLDTLYTVLEQSHPDLFANTPE